MTNEAIDVPHAQATLEHIVKSVVEKPDQVQIDITNADEGISMSVKVGDGDMGRVIGRRGRIANAIRTVVQAAALQDGVAVNVEFVD
ncbi:MAG: KH domain-containing protein [Acidimicrobiales bacterium]|nr:KH domain-containing protein [Acidimicrobiales bacterium]